MMENHTKTDSWFQKSHEKFGELQTGSGKSNKLKFDWLILSKKCILSAKALYTDLTTLLSTTYSSNSEITYAIFENKSFFTTILLCICSAQALHNFDKSGPSKCKFPLLALKFFKFLMSFFVIFQ